MNRPVFKELKNYGWIEHRMDNATVNHIWDCIESQGKSMKNSLVGQIDKSYEIFDKDNWLWDNVLDPLYHQYRNRWGQWNITLPIRGDFAPYLDEMWVNYANQHEYNPFHDHSGVYSFAAWLKIPTVYEEQAQHYNSVDAGAQFNSTFNFQYIDITGRMQVCKYALTPEYENLLLFFPSCLQHCVYPFYNCDDQRISISGNIWLKDINK